MFFYEDNVIDPGLNLSYDTVDKKNMVLQFSIFWIISECKCKYLVCIFFFIILPIFITVLFLIFGFSFFFFFLAY